MRSSVLVAALGVLLALPAMASAAPRRADLQVRAVSTASTQEAPGSRLTASATVRNGGRKTAPATRLGFYLSRDRRKGRGDFLLTPRARVRPRKPRTRQTLLRTLTVPTSVRAGSYFLLACADDTRRVRESREHNNCLATAGQIRIVVFPIPTPNPVTPVLPGLTTPAITVSGPPDGTATFDATPTYSGTARSTTASIARVEAQVDGGSFSTAGVSCSGCGSLAASWTFSPSPLSQGSHTLAFRAVDVGGRTSPTLSRTVTVDTTAPSFISISASPGSTSVTATFSEPLACSTVNAFDFTAEINGSPVAVNQTSCSASQSTVTLTLGSAPAAGAGVSVTLTGVISDPAGNVTPRPTTRSTTA